MFIINLTYKAELKKIDLLLEEHILFLNNQYALGNFLASGRKIPRTGGIILSNITTKAALDKIIAQDPFKRDGLADYDFIEFIPSKTSPELSFLIPKEVAQ
jgi:uncharacterized protein YciI